MRFNITQLLSQIREAHKRLPSSDMFRLHVEIFSSDKMVGLHQYVNNVKHMTLIRYYDDSNVENSSVFFDLELSALLSNYLSMISRG